MKQPVYTWDEELGVATCTIFYKDIEFYGQAICHPDDKDMMSRLVGQTIADMRATLWYLRHVRDNELRPQLQVLYQLYYSMKHSKNFNPKSYEAKMLYKQIHFIEKNLSIVKEDIAELYLRLSNYIEQKDIDHKLIKEFRAKKQMVETN